MSEHDGVLPECQVMFEGLGRDLHEIKDTVNKILWWIMGALSAVVFVVLPVLVAVVLRK